MLGEVQSVMLVLFQLIMAYSLIRLMQTRELPEVHAIAWGALAILDGLAFFLTLFFAPLWASVSSFVIGLAVVVYALFFNNRS